MLVRDSMGLPQCIETRREGRNISGGKECRQQRLLEVRVRSMSGSVWHASDVSVLGIKYFISLVHSLGFRLNANVFQVLSDLEVFRYPFMSVHT